MTNLASDSFSPAQVDLLNLLAYQHLQNGNPERALLYLEALKELQIFDQKIYLSLAYALLQCDRAQEALAVLEDKRSGKSHEPLVHLFRGRALTLLGRLPEASQAMRRFIHFRQIEK